MHKISTTIRDSRDKVRLIEVVTHNLDIIIVKQVKYFAKIGRKIQEMSDKDR
jgi:hypothetical protein